LTLGFSVCTIFQWIKCILDYSYGPLWNDSTLNLLSRPSTKLDSNRSTTHWHFFGIDCGSKVESVSAHGPAFHGLGYCNMPIRLWLLPPNFARLRPLSTTSAGMADANSTRLQPDKLSFARVLCLCWPNGKVLAYRQGIGCASREAWEREAKYVINIILAQLLQSDK
jgi:hypothetical protein